jgi:YD repeat-containing protein
LFRKEVRPLYPTLSDSESNRVTLWTNELGQQVAYDPDTHGNVVAIEWFDPGRSQLTGSPGRRGQNLWNRYDVNANQYVTPEDVLTVINDINSHGSRAVTTAAPAPPYLDVNGDDHVTPIDVLQIINHINAGQPNNPVDVGLGNAHASYTYTSEGMMASSSVGTGRSTGTITTTYGYYPISANLGQSGQLGVITYPGDPTVSYGYDSYGNVNSVTDELARVTQFRYDALDRLVAVYGGRFGSTAG